MNASAHDIIAMLRDVDEELEGAMHYAKIAYDIKGTHKNYADTFIAMANQELAHAENIHSMVGALQGPSEQGKVMWDFENERYLKKKREVMMLIDEVRK